MNDERNVIERLDDIEKAIQELSNKSGEEHFATTSHITQSQMSGNSLNPYIPQQTISNRPYTPTQENPQAILKNFIKNSVQRYHWLGASGDFYKEQGIAKILFFISIAVMIVTTIVSTVAFGIYSTFTFFENIWLIFTIIILKNIYKAQWKYPTEDFQRNSACSFINDNGMLRVNTYKKRYRIFFVLAIISVICNLICCWMWAKGAIAVFSTIFEITSGIMIAVSMFKATSFFAGYSHLSFTGKNQIGQEISIFYDPIINKFYSKEEYEKMFSFMK